MKDVLRATVFVGLFAVPFLTLYVENDYFFPFITGKNFWFRIIVDTVFAAWIILAFYEAKYRPKISGIVWSFGILLVVMYFADLFGLHPKSSFWSNFERMDGYVSLLHTFIYMLVLGSVLQTKKHWRLLLNTSLFVAFAVALYGLAQYGGMIEGGNRIDSRLGNAAYMAIYMLFHIFVAFWLFVESKKTLNKGFYGLLAVIFTFVLVETGTRGTAIGLVVGVMVMLAYIGLFGTKFKQYRKYAIGGVVLVMIAATAFITGRDSEIVQNNKNLARIANISLHDLEIRGIIWGMAWEGVKEKPLLGYGQSNFNYVFNEKYDPRLYAQEQWFDRSHNIFMDWLITGGFLGLIAYLSIFGWCAYYLFFRPLFNKEDESFNVLERGVLLGILAGYFTHNIVVFDNIVSYIFFAIILGLINSRVGLVPKRIAKFKIDDLITTQFITPVVMVLLVVSIYVFHVPGMQAAGDLISGFRSADLTERLDYFKDALDRDSFAHQEITEQITQQAMSVVMNNKIPEDIRAQYAELAEGELDKLIEEKPGDARIHVFVGSYYRAINNLEQAAKHMEIAHQLSPKKQSILIQQGFIALSQAKIDEAVNYMKIAFELDERNLEAREYYAGALMYKADYEGAIALMDSEKAKDKFARSNFIISTANQFGQIDFVIELFEYRINKEPDKSQNWKNEAQNWATLAYLYYQKGEIEKAVSTLETAKEGIPSFATTATCFIDSMEEGLDPQEECQ